ncbi:MAG: NYN domain-containing protein [Actinomycetota bacterium]
MAEPTYLERADTRVAVYIDFDNIVISRYDQKSKRGQFHKDEVRKFDPSSPNSEVAKKLDDATVDLGAVLDFASSFGTIAVSRAYADWSVPVNASYRSQLIERAVDLVQLFPTVQSMKNGADIRLAVDVVEDLFRLSDLTHVVIVAGDSDYIALAQRCKQLGRYVVGIGVAGATSKALAAACNEFKDYDALPGLTVTEPAAPARKQPTKNTASDLLVRALQLGQSKTDDEWQSSGTVKNQMLRMDPTFQERALGFRSFSDFVKSLDALVELDESQSSRPMRLRGKG